MKYGIYLIRIIFCGKSVKTLENQVIQVIKSVFAAPYRIYYTESVYRGKEAKSDIRGKFLMQYHLGSFGVLNINEMKGEPLVLLDGGIERRQGEIYDFHNGKRPGYGGFYSSIR